MVIMHVSVKDVVEIVQVSDENRHFILFYKYQNVPTSFN